MSTKRIVLQDEVPLETPLLIYLEVSGVCNLKCKFCPQGTYADKLKKDIMSYSLLKKIVDDIKEFNQKLCLIRICGDGEPLLNKDLGQMLKYIKDNQVTKRIELVTNGIALNERLAEEISRYADRIIISVEGLSQEDYLNYSQKEIDFDSFVDKVKMLHNESKKQGNCKIHIKIHESSVKTEERREKFFELFEGICDEISIENLVEMWPEIKFKNLDVDNKFRYNKLEALDTILYRNRNVCPQMFKGIQIYANGDTTPCCVDWQRKNMLGNLNDKSIKEIWLGDALRKLQLQHLNLEKGSISPCKDCSMNDYAEVDYLDDDRNKIIERMQRVK
jgi:radical SAM protein with 4Fe4S-binding SPASM domain